MAHQHDRIDPTLTQLVGRAWRGALAVGIGYTGWYAIEAGIRGDLPLTVAMVGVLLALSVVLLASALVATWGGR